PPKPAAPVKPVAVQSLTPTGMTGAVPHPAVPAPVAAPPVSHAPAVHGAAPPVEILPGHVPIAPPPKRNFLVVYWAAIGGGSLMLSIGIHVGLIAAFIAIVFTTIREPKVDFLPGGGSKQGQEA